MNNEYSRATFVHGHDVVDFNEQGYQTITNCVGEDTYLGSIS
jgi:hypothetical protein